jgi:tubulin polyglutamylase TTLL4
MHLTNFSVNESDADFMRSEGGVELEENSKWSLAFWKEHMQSIGIDPEPIMREMEHIAIAAIIAGICEIQKVADQAIAHRHTSYENYGVDIILDEDLRAYLTEINISPSMSGADSPLDAAIKFPLNLDVLRMARIIECDAEGENPCPAIAAIDECCARSLTTGRVRSVESGEIDPWTAPIFADFVIVRDFLEESTIQSGFRLVYPADGDRYMPYFDCMKYHDIVFQRWMHLDPASRLSVVRDHWRKYSRKMSDIVTQTVASSNTPT